MIIGRPGSGKSTFAVELNKLTKLPLIHIDKYVFLPNWIKKNSKECKKIIQNIISKDKWIIDGNDASTIEMRYQRADVCLYFNFSKILCSYRVIKRYFFKDKTINDRAEGCKELIDFGFLRYIWNYEKYVDETVAYLQSKYPKTTFIKFFSDKDSKKFLKIITGFPDKK